MLEEVGLRVDSGLTALNSYENCIYQFMGEDRHRYVVKFYRPECWSAQQISEEYQFVLDLVQTETPTVVLLVLQGNTLHSYGDFFFTVFPSAGGR